MICKWSWHFCRFLPVLYLPKACRRIRFDKLRSPFIDVQACKACVNNIVWVMCMTSSLARTIDPSRWLLSSNIMHRCNRPLTSANLFESWIIISRILTFIRNWRDIQIIGSDENALPFKRYASVSKHKQTRRPSYWKLIFIPNSTGKQVWWQSTSQPRYAQKHCNW